MELKKKIDNMSTINLLHVYLILNFISLTLCLDGRGWKETKKEDDQNVQNLKYKKFGHLPSTLFSSPSTFETIYIYIGLITVNLPVIWPVLTLSTHDLKRVTLPT